MCFQTDSLIIQWYCHGVAGGLAQPPEQAAAALMTPPDQVIQGEEELKKIEKLDFYEACTLQLGDKRYYKIDAEDILYPMEVWKSVALNLFGQQVKIIHLTKEKT